MSETKRKAWCSGMTAAMAGGLLLPALPAMAQQHAADPAQGRKLAETHCARCHAVDETGASPRADAPPLRELKRRYPVDNLAEAMAEGLSTGHPDMPEFTFTPEQVADLLGYLKALP
jgi:mono/diheme cytochrome c family protein